MKSLRELYRIGCGPSSSHTMGPRAAAQRYLSEHPDARAFRVTLYGSLAATGKGHLTDWAIEQVLGKERTEIVWRPDIVSPFHPNGMKFEVLEKAGIFEDAWTVFSVGGGALAEAGRNELDTPEVFPHDHLSDIQMWCRERGRNYWDMSRSTRERRFGISFSRFGRRCARPWSAGSSTRVCCQGCFI